MCNAAGSSRNLRYRIFLISAWEGISSWSFRSLWSITSLKSIKPRLAKSGMEWDSPSSRLALRSREFLNNSSSMGNSWFSLSVLSVFASSSSTSSSCSIFIVGISSLTACVSSLCSSLSILSPELVLGLFKKSLTRSVSSKGDAGKSSELLLCIPEAFLEGCICLVSSPWGTEPLAPTNTEDVALKFGEEFGR